MEMIGCERTCSQQEMFLRGYLKNERTLKHYRLNKHNYMKRRNKVNGKVKDISL